VGDKGIKRTPNGDVGIYLGYQKKKKLNEIYSFCQKKLPRDTGDKI